MKKIIVFVLLTCVPYAYSQSSLSLLSDTTKNNLPRQKLTLRENPKIEVGDLAKEFASGYSLGLLVGFITVGAVYGLGGGAAGHGGGEGVYSVLLVGHCIGSIFGVNIGSSTENVSGNLWLSMAGGAAGTIGSLYYLSDNGKLGDFFIAATLPTVGAIIGYNSMLRYTDKKNENEKKDNGTHLKMKNDFEMTILKINF